MDKEILLDYIDACELVKETEKEIRELEHKKTMQQEGVVKGSNPEFPYQPQNFHISGTGFRYEDDRELRRKAEVLEGQKARAGKIKEQPEAWMGTIPVRMQRIIKYKIFEGMSWEETAARMGRKATGESVKKEYQRFLKGK